MPDLDPNAVILAGRRHRGWLRALHAFEKSGEKMPAKMRKSLAAEVVKLRSLADRIERAIGPPNRHEPSDRKVSK